MVRVGDVVEECYRVPLSLQSNYARERAFEVGIAASMGLISTETIEGFTRQWRATEAGIAWIFEG